DNDAFSEKSIIDMSGLLHKPAGKFGFLKAAGKDLKFEQGAEAVKFWGVNAGAEMKNSPDDMARRARYFAKHGVNMIRQQPMQDLQLKYAKVIMEHVNPYTKLAYKDDPALAVLEIHNEDCVFFHNPLTGLAGNKPPRHAQLVRKMFCDWAKKKYATDEALQK